MKKSGEALRDEARRVFSELFGPEVAKQVDNFDKPEEYPKEFLDECTFFLGKLIGDDAAKKKFEPLRKKYLTEEEANEQKSAGRSKRRKA
jgi:hypothetical protein